MKFIRFLRELPKLPLSALLFYIIAIILGSFGIIPPPTEIVIFLESLYNQYGLVGLSIAAFLEGIVYLGLYFPGSFIIALSVFLSDGKPLSLFLISFVVALTLTITSLINYFFGRHIKFRNKGNENLLKKQEKLSKGLILSHIHPNLLAFYFFNAGLKKHNPWKIMVVPLIMIPYGFLLALILSSFKVFLRSKLESPFVMFLLIFLWIVVAFIIEHKSKRRFSSS